MKSVGVRASQDKWLKIRNRAGELAVNRGKGANEANNEDVRRAQRELLGLQTMTNPDEPLSSDHG